MTLEVPIQLKYLSKIEKPRLEANLVIFIIVTIEQSHR